MRYCSKCGNQVNGEEQKFCSKCGAELQSNFVIQENVYDNLNTTKQDFSMKWYKFLIYFALFLGAFLNACMAICYLNGDIYSVQTNGRVMAEMVYGMYGNSLKVWDGFYGVLLICVAVFGIVTRHGLARYRANAPKCVYALYIAGGAASLIYNIGVLFITNATGVLNAAFWFSEVVTAIFVFANYKYFSKRAELFMN